MEHAEEGREGTCRREGGIEVGFDSTILMFLVCTVDPTAALLIWSLGVVISQITTEREQASILEASSRAARGRRRSAPRCRRRPGSGP